MSAAPKFASIPRVVSVQVTTANANTDGVTGAYSANAATGANGSLLPRIELKAVGSTVQGLVRIFMNDGANTRLYAECEVDEKPASDTEESFSAVLYLPVELFLQSGITFKASTTKGNTINVLFPFADFGA